MKNWDEGGANRIALHVAGGALIGGLGGGSAFTTIGGAAGAGISSKLAGQTKGISDAVSDATGSSLAGNIIGNIASGLGGAVVGGKAGAASSSNVNLYNQGHDKNETEAQKEAKDIQAQVAKERAAMGETSYAPQAGNDGAAAASPAHSIAAGLAGAAKSPTPASVQIVSDIGAQGVNVSYPTPLTKGSATQIVVGMTQQDAIVSLQSNGYSTSYGGNDAVTLLSKDGVTYTFYGASTGNGIAGAQSGVPSASVTVNGQATKIRFTSK